jgi:transcription elongation factor
MAGHAVAEVVDSSTVKLATPAQTTTNRAPGWWGTDDTAAIQAAIDYAIHSAKCVVYASAGAALVSDTVHCGYGIGFSATTFEGEDTPMAAMRPSADPRSFRPSWIAC